MYRMPTYLPNPIHTGPHTPLLDFAGEFSIVCILSGTWSEPTWIFFGDPQAALPWGQHRQHTTSADPQERGAGVLSIPKWLWLGLQSRFQWCWVGDLQAIPGKTPISWPTPSLASLGASSHIILTHVTSVGKARSAEPSTSTTAWASQTRENNLEELLLIRAHLKADGDRVIDKAGVKWLPKEMPPQGKEQPS